MLEKVARSRECFSPSDADADAQREREREYRVQSIEHRIESIEYRAESQVQTSVQTLR